MAALRMTGVAAFETYTGSAGRSEGGRNETFPGFLSVSHKNRQADVHLIYVKSFVISNSFT